MSKPALKWIIVTGNPVDGLVFTGPFKRGLVEGIEWAERNVSGADSWWPARLNSPYTDEEEKGQ